MDESLLQVLQKFRAAQELDPSNVQAKINEFFVNLLTRSWYKKGTLNVEQMHKKLSEIQKLNPEFNKKHRIVDRIYRGNIE